MRNPAFNVSVGLGINCTFNEEQARLLSNLILTVSEDDMMLDRLYDKLGEPYRDGLPACIFSFAEKLEAQANTASEYQRRSNRRPD